MSNKVRPIGLAIAALVLMALGAGSAQAAKFEASGYPATITGTVSKGSDGFVTEAGIAECFAHYEGTLAAASSEFALHPTYTSCEFVKVAATVTTNGCNFVFHLTSVTSATVDIACTEGSVITVKAGTCEFHIPPQTGLATVVAGNIGVRVELNPRVKEMDYNVTQDGFLCPFKGTGTKVDGQWIADILLSNTAAGGSFAIV